MFGTPLGRINTNDAYAGEAIVSIEGRVLNLFEVRSNNNNKSATIGNQWPVTKANTGLPIYFGAVAVKTPSHNGPPVFASFTGYPTRNKTAKELQRELFFVGMLKQGISFDGMIPPQDKVTLQTGGSGSLRYFSAAGDESISVGDYLAWEIPDVSDGGVFEKQMGSMQSLPSDTIPRGMVPVVYRPVTQTSLREFPIMCMEKFASKPDVYLSGGNFPDIIQPSKQDSSDPVDKFIIYGIIWPALRHLILNPPNAPLTDAQKNDIYAFNAGLCLKKIASGKLGAVQNLTPEKIKQLRNYSARNMGAQFDAFLDSWSRVVGMALAPARHGDLARVLFRP